MAKKAPNPIDKHVGSRVRMRRMMLSMSQEKLGDALGLTFQQVQKYEKGTNRIGASRLQQIAQILQVPVSFFFEGAPPPPGRPVGMGEAPSPAYVTDFLATTDGLTLVTRGMDLFPATHVHRLLQALLGLPVPAWHHHPLLLDAAGTKLAKRRNSPSLADRRLAGEDGPALADSLREGRLPAGITLSEGLDIAP